MSAVAELSSAYLSEVNSTAIPVGYKQTEIGIIPIDWEVRTLEQLVAFRNGAAHENCIDDSGDYVVVNSKFISTEGLIRKGSKECRQPAYQSELLMVMSDVPNGRAIAKCYLVESNDTYTVNQRICALKSIAIEARFLFYKLNRNPFYLAFDDGAKQTNLRRQDVLDCPIPVPPKAEQTAIANALSDVDALIGELEKLIAKKQAIKTATMQQLLTGRTRLPQFALREDGSRKGTKPSELGEIPEDWEVVEFSSIVWFQEGPGVRQYQFTSSGIKLLNGTNIENGSLLLEKTQRFISEKLAYGQYSHFMIDAGDILIACSGVTIARFDEKVTVAGDGDLPLCLNTSTMRFKIRSDNTDKFFIKNFLKSSFFKDQIGGKATGSAQLNFGPYHVNQVKISVPNKKEQTAIATILSDMDEEIQALEQRLGKTRQIKQGMMQELLTGKTRLPFNKD